MIKLQINLKGSWRDVLRFDESDVDSVKAHARSLLMMSGDDATLRIADHNNVALERCARPSFDWKKAR